MPAPAPAARPASGRPPLRGGGPSLRAALLLVILVVSIRLLLLLCGRATVEDAFYLRNALAWGAGDTPYEDFQHVAFPVVDALYAFLLGPLGLPLGGASLLTGGFSLLLSLALLFWVGEHHGTRAGFGAALAAAVAQPVLAFHWFERELPAAAFGALAAAALLGVRPPGGRRAFLAGTALAGALFAKLTALWIVVAVLTVALLEGRRRAALLASLTGASLFLAVTAALAARFEGEFLSSTFLFFFFRGRAHDLADRALLFWRHLDPLLALGLVALPFLARRAAPPVRLASVLAPLVLVHYAVLAGSFWNHNSLDLLLPGALGFGCALTLGKRTLAPLAAAALLLASPSLGVVPGQRPTWFPLGFGGPEGDASRERAAWIARRCGAGDVVLCDPETALFARRSSFVGDWEVEPVARALLVELRRHGLASALAKRTRRGALGAALGDSPPSLPRASPFVERAFACSSLHLVPRVRDAVRARELAVVVEPVLPAVIRSLETAGYRREAIPAGTAWTRPPAEER